MSTAEILIARLNKRAHITVVGTKDELDAAAVTFGWQYDIKPLCEAKDTVIGVIDYNTNDVFAIISNSWEVWTVREQIISNSRYNKVFELDSPKLQSLFFPDYQGIKEGLNAQVEAEQISHWCKMIDNGFGFSWDHLKYMMDFCELNELYDQAAQIKTKLDDFQI